MPKPFVGPSDTQVKPDPALERRTRRQFSTQYKLRILHLADACKYGEIGALLRSEGLYHSQLSDWRRERDSGDLDALSKTEPGPKPKLSAEQRRIGELEKQVARLQRQMQIKDDCLELQKKAISILDQCDSASDA
ncbi:MAG: transposase [Burkholderiaceae bacterium]